MVELKIGVFLATAKSGEDEQLKDLAQGINKTGDWCFLHKNPTYRECDVAVIHGTTEWIKDKYYNKAKQIIYDNHKGRTIHMDGTILRNSTDKKLYRISLNSVFPSTADYVNQNSSSDRWNTLGIEIKPWRSNGDHILLYLQSNKGWSMKGVDPICWAIDTINTLRKYTDRKILIRCHPSSKFDQKIFNQKNIHFSNLERKYDVKYDMINAWATVMFNSSVSTDNIVNGIPVFLGDNDCLSYPVANTDLSRIESPDLPAREQWCYNLAYSSWTSYEMKNGIVWERFKHRIENG